MVVFPALYGKAPVLPEKFQRVAQNLTFPVYHFKPAFPMPSGGIRPRMVSSVIKDLGPDLVIGSGGGIQAHPQGPVAGAKAFRQAIDATLQRRSLDDAAKEYPELKASLEAWVDPFKGMGM